MRKAKKTYPLQHRIKEIQNEIQQENNSPFQQSITSGSKYRPAIKQEFVKVDKYSPLPVRNLRRWVTYVKQGEKVELKIKYYHVPLSLRPLTFSLRGSGSKIEKKVTLSRKQTSATLEFIADVDGPYWLSGRGGEAITVESNHPGGWSIYRYPSGVERQR